MKGKDINNNYLAKWLNHGISDTELKSLVGKTDFEAYNKIKMGLNQFKAPDFDGAKMFKNIESATTKSSGRVVKLIPNWVYSAAASIALLLAGYLFFFSNTTLKTNFGEQSAFNFTDGSIVKLNAKSTLSYNKRHWATNRTVELNGEAYFEVSHGSLFTVNTKVGTIKVLGTHFNVKVTSGFLNVTCYTGKIQVIVNNKRLILTKGQVYQFAKNSTSKWTIDSNKPNWISGKSVYKNTPLFVIINDLEHQFNIDIDSSHLNKDQILTASYDYDDLNLALQSIFTPLNYNYSIKNNNKVTLSKK